MSEMTPQVQTDQQVPEPSPVVAVSPGAGPAFVTSEKGQACLVEAKPEYHELARFQAIEGKTWNHPVIAHGKLFVRNGEEIACYQLSESSSRTVTELPKKP
jgi:hypothetical protein